MSDQQFVIRVLDKVTPKQAQYIQDLLRKLASTRTGQRAELADAKRTLKLSSSFDRSDASRLITYLKQRVEKLKRW